MTPLRVIIIARRPNGCAPISSSNLSARHALIYLECVLYYGLDSLLNWTGSHPLLPVDRVFCCADSVVIAAHAIKECYGQVQISAVSPIIINWTENQLMFLRLTRGFFSSNFHRTNENSISSKLNQLVKRFSVDKYKLLSFEHQPTKISISPLCFINTLDEH